MQPSELLDREAISIANTAGSKKRVLEEAAALLAASLPESDPETIYERLLERERLGSTGVGHGVALPHARIDGLTRAYGAFVQLGTAGYRAGAAGDRALCDRLRVARSEGDIIAEIRTPPGSRHTA